MGAISQQTYDTAKMNYDVAKAAYDQAVSNTNDTNIIPLSTVMSSANLLR
jgi:hypothetical protein